MSENSKTNNSNINSRSEIILNNTIVISDNIKKICERLEETRELLSNESDNEYDDMCNRIQFYFATIINEAKLKFYEQIKEYKLINDGLQLKVIELEENIVKLNKEIDKLKEDNKEKIRTIKKLNENVKMKYLKIENSEDFQIVSHNQHNLIYKKSTNSNVANEKQNNIGRLKISGNINVANSSNNNNTASNSNFISENESKLKSKSKSKSKNKTFIQSKYQTNWNLYNSLSKSKGKILADVKYKNINSIGDNNISQIDLQNFKTRNNKSENVNKYNSFADLTKNSIGVCSNIGNISTNNININVLNSNISSLNSNLNKYISQKNIFNLSNSTTNLNPKEEKSHINISKDKIYNKISSNSIKYNMTELSFSEDKRNSSISENRKEKKALNTINLDELNRIEENPNEIRKDTEECYNSSINFTNKNKYSPNNMKSQVNVENSGKSKLNNNLTLGLKALNENLKAKLNLKFNSKK